MATDNAPQEAASDAKKSPSMIVTIASIAVLTLIGAGGGWVIGGLVAPASPEVAEPAKPEAEAAKGEGEKKEEGLARISTQANGIVLLEPITTNLAYPSDNWIRLEVALMFTGLPDVKVAEDVHQDILSYMRTVSLQQLEGPRGFQYLRDDIQERVDLRSEGRVSKVMFRTFVIE